MAVTIRRLFRYALVVPIVLAAGSSPAVEDNTDRCSTPFENTTLFYKPKGLTLISGIIDTFDQPTPLNDGGPFQSVTDWQERRRRIRNASTLLRGDREKEQEIFTRQWGFIINDCDRVHGLTWRPVENGTILGRKSKIGLMSCAMCHTGRVAGRMWEGLGNKRIDVNTVGRDADGLLKWVARARNFVRVADNMAQQIDENAIEFNARLADLRMGNRTVGLVPDAHVTWWIWNEAGQGAQPANPPRGEMKVPSLWNFAWRRGRCDNIDCDVGLFIDGFGTGQGWIGGAVLGGGQDLDVVERADYQAMVSNAEKVLLRDLPGPPPFPCAIDEELAEKGKSLYSSKGCIGCHESRPGFPPHMKSIEKVGTDAERLKLIGADEFGANTRSRMDYITSRVPRLVRARYKDLDADGTVTHGYIAPRLEGVWARFPYLHNGSVPTLYDLLSPPESRPEQFDLTLVDTRECFDPVRGGLKDNAACKPNLSQWKKPDLSNGEPFEQSPPLRNVYDTRLSGHRNSGHAFWKDAAGNWTLGCEDRIAIIEYLKTLGGTKLDPAWCPPGVQPARNYCAGVKP